jgi:hypothetical protein
MPVLKVTEAVRKIALEVVRVPISILGDCPQCQGNGYRDGICPDCNYIDPRVLEAIQEWQQAQGIQQKAAFRSLSFVDQFPDAYKAKEKCPRCGELTFNNDSLKKGDLSGSCENPACGHEIAGALGFKRPKFLGIDPRMIKKVQRNFLSPAGLKIEKNKKQLKKSAKDNSDLGAIQDDSMNASMDATTRMKNLLQQSAQMDAQNKNDENAESKELQ